MEELIQKIRRIRMPAVVQMAVSLIIYAAALFPVVLLIYYSPRLPYIWILLLFGYLALLNWIRAALKWEKEKTRLIYYLGIDGFYEAFPNEKKRLERKEMRVIRRRERREHIRSYF